MQSCSTMCEEECDLLFTTGKRTRNVVVTGPAYTPDRVEQPQKLPRRLQAGSCASDLGGIGHSSRSVVAVIMKIVR